MRKPTSLLLALGVSAGLTAGASAALAQDKTNRISGPPAISGPGVYFGAQDKPGVELAFDEINRSGLNGYRFPVQYESGPPAPPRPVQQQATSVQTKRESRQSRPRPPQPSPKTGVGK
jgi:hypothetical protein